MNDAVDCVGQFCVSNKHYTSRGRQAACKQCRGTGQQNQVTYKRVYLKDSTLNSL